MTHNLCVTSILKNKIFHRISIVFIGKADGPKVAEKKESTEYRQIGNKREILH